MIDWKFIAEQNGMTPEEFKKEIYTTAAILGAMDLDLRRADKDEAMKFTARSEDGDIEVYIRYADT